MIDVNQGVQTDLKREVVNLEETMTKDMVGHATHRINITVEAIDMQVEVEVEEMSSSSGVIQTLGKAKILAEADVTTAQELMIVCKHLENALMLMVEIREVERITDQQTMLEEKNNQSNVTTDAVKEKIADLPSKTTTTTDQTNAKLMIRQMVEIVWQGCRVRSEGP